MKCLEIRDSKNKDLLSVTLFELLDFKKDFFENLNWSFYDLSATSYINSDINLLDIREKIMVSPLGLNMSWNEVLNFTKKLDQVFDLVLVGTGNKNDFIKFEDNTKWRSRYTVVIEIVDGAYWEVYSKNINLIDDFSKHYKDTRLKNF